MKKVFISIFTFVVLYLPLLVLAQGTPNADEMAQKTHRFSHEMMKVVMAQPENFKSLKGSFYVTDESGNNYYLVKNIDLLTEKEYVEVKKNGHVGFIASWPMHKKDDIEPSIAMAAFRQELAQMQETIGYTIEDGGMDPLTHENKYYLKSPGDKGKRVAMLIFNPEYREAAFIVDSDL